MLGIGLDSDWINRLRGNDANVCLRLSWSDVSIYSSWSGMMRKSIFLTVCDSVEDIIQFRWSVVKMHFSQRGMTF